MQRRPVRPVWQPAPSYLQTIAVHMERASVAKATDFWPKSKNSDAVHHRKLQKSGAEANKH